MLCFNRSLFFFFFFFFLYCTSAIIHIQLWAASIDGLRPSWQPAIISTLSPLLLYISDLANKIVVVVVAIESGVYLSHDVY